MAIFEMIFVSMGLINTLGMVCILDILYQNDGE